MEMNHSPFILMFPHLCFDAGDPEPVSVIFSYALCAVSENGDRARQIPGCRLLMLQRMNDLQTVAFVASAYDPVANGNGSREKLKEVEKHKES